MKRITIFLSLIAMLFVGCNNDHSPTEQYPCLTYLGEDGEKVVKMNYVSRTAILNFAITPAQLANTVKEQFDAGNDVVSVFIKYENELLTQEVREMIVSGGGEFTLTIMENGLSAEFWIGAQEVNACVRIQEQSGIELISEDIPVVVEDFEASKLATPKIEDKTTCGTYYASWTPVENASYYYVCVDEAQKTQPFTDENAWQKTADTHWSKAYDIATTEIGDHQYIYVVAAPTNPLYAPSDITEAKLYALLQLASPTNLITKPIAGDIMRISWDPVPDADYYEVYLGNYFSPGYHEFERAPDCYFDVPTTEEYEGITQEYAVRAGSNSPYIVESEVTAGVFIYELLPPVEETKR